MKNLEKILKNIENLFKEYDDIKNYNYDKYLDEFHALNRKRDIENCFDILGIKYNYFQR